MVQPKVLLDYKVDVPDKQNKYHSDFNACDVTLYKIHFS